jgi:ribosomal protein S18 acetylase RimI-like enzyme
MTTTATELAASSVRFREARPEDLERIVQLLAADSLGTWRDSLTGGSLPDAFARAFDEIATDPRNQVIVGELGAAVVACLQLTFIPGLTYIGGERAHIEGIRVDRALRGGGIGKALIRHAIELARQRGCVLVQLTSDKRRSDAHAFYRSLGFVASHEGMKLVL